jgi:hypothetical protein
MRSTWLSEYILDNNTLSRTDIVVTFPTRRYYVTPTAASAPFTKPALASASCPPGAGEGILTTYFNRDERAAPLVCTDLCPQLPPPPSLCAASTAISIVDGAGHMPQPGPSGVLGASSTLFTSLASQTFQHGWLGMSPAVTLPITSLEGSTRLTSATGAVLDGAHRFLGLPVVGFTVRTFRVNALPCLAGVCQGNFGGAYPLRYRRSVAPVS